MNDNNNNATFRVVRRVSNKSLCHFILDEIGILYAYIVSVSRVRVNCEYIIEIDAASEG